MHSTTVLVRRNPMVDSRRKALDAVTHSLALHGVWVNEFSHPDGTKGAEYAQANVKNGVVLATLEHRPDTGCDLKYAEVSSPSKAQMALIEAHSAIYLNL